MLAPLTEKDMLELFETEEQTRDSSLGLRPCTGKFKYLWIDCPESASGGYFMCWREFR